jgi:light-regulated signal transduction histidine kinase (bacteriophytochrome)
VTQSGTQTAAVPETGLHEIVQHAVHELRQPLGGIESLAYYFELALEDADDELREQCGRLRQLVAQAGWILEDASLAAAASAIELSPVNLNSLAVELGERLARHEDRSVQLVLEPDVPMVAGPRSLLRRWLDHVIAFLRDLAGGEPMPRVETAREDGGVWLRVQSRVSCGECLRSLDPPGNAGGLRRVAELAGGRFECEVRGANVSTAIWLPAAGHPLN